MAFVNGLGAGAARAASVPPAAYAATVADSLRNRGICCCLAAAGAFPNEAASVDAAVELYAAMDCLECDTELVARIAAHLAALPGLGTAAVSRPTAHAVLAAMATCGMYQGSGRWMLEVGLPAKSGVSGSIMAVAPGKLGIAVYGPGIDAEGNSVRGMRFLRHFVRHSGVSIWQGAVQMEGLAECAKG